MSGRAGRGIDLKTLYALALAPIRGETHHARLESFYGRQAAGYDAFRERLLKGREAMIASLAWPDGGTWIDVGGGTASTLEFLGPAISRLRHVVVVDACQSLLRVARQRRARLGWMNVSLVRGDATAPFARPASADVITFSYSLMMIPD